MAEMPPIALIASTTASSSSDRQSHRMLAFGVAQEQGPLADGEVRLDADADQPRLLELDRVPVGQPQLVQRGPLLAGRLDVLPLVLADGAGSRAAGRSRRIACRRLCR